MPALPPTPSSPTFWVVCLCAQWCDVCRQYRPQFEALAHSWPQLQFLLLDVEDEEAIVDDFDIPTFPTLLLANVQAGAVFCGPLLPQIGILERMLRTLEQSQPASLPDPAAQALWQRIAASPLTACTAN